MSRTLVSRRATRVPNDRIRRATLEVLERRQLLSAVPAEGAIASFYASDTAAGYPFSGDSVAGQNQFSSDGKTDEGAQASGTGVLGYQEIYKHDINANGLDANAPVDAPASFNTVTGAAGPGHHFAVRFSGLFTPTVTGYYTLLIATDDGGSIAWANADGSNPVTLPTDNILTLRGNTLDTDPVVDATGTPVQWVKGQQYQIQFDMNNNGGGWDYHLYDAISSTGDNQTNALYDVQDQTVIPASQIGTPVPAFKTIDLAHPTGLSKDDSFYQLTALGGDGFVQLNWNNIAADSYNVYRAGSASGPFTKLNTAPIPAVAGTITYKDSGLANGTPYFYLVTGVDQAGETAQSAGITASATPQQGPPQKVTGLSVSRAGVSKVSGSFTAAFGATSYDVKRGTALNADGTLGGTITDITPGGTTGTTFTDTNAAGGPFYYAVTATNQFGTGPVSAAVRVGAGDGFLATFYSSDSNGTYPFDGDSVVSTDQVTPDGKGVVSDGMGGTAQPTGSAVLGPEAGETAPAGYEEVLTHTIDFSGNDNTAPPDAPGTFNLVQGAGNPGHQFAVRFSGFFVAPKDGFYGLGFATDDGGAITIADVDPTKITSSNPYGLVNPRTLVDNITALRGNTEDDTAIDEPLKAGQKIYLQFDMNNNGGGWDFHAYDAAASTADKLVAFNFDVQPKQAIDPGDVIAPPPVFMTVDAANLGGLTKDNSYYTGSAKVGDANALDLSFNNIGADSYNIYRSDSQNGTYTKVNAAPVPAHAGTVTYTDTGLTGGQTYFYIVTGVNASGETPQAAGLHLSGTAVAHPQLPAPTVSVQACDPGTLAVTMTDTNPKVQQYMIEQSTDGTTFTTVATVNANASGSTIYSASGLDTSKTYTYRVTALGHNNPFADSTAVTATGVQPNNTPHVPVDYSTGFANNQGNLQLNSGGTDPATFTTPTGGTGTALQLTANAGNEAVSAVTKTYEHVDSFDTTFNFEFSGDQGADGFTFVMQNDPTNGAMAVGGGGGALGYQGIANSVAVKFDLWNGGPTATTTGVYTNGEAVTDAPLQIPGNPDPAPLHTTVDLSKSGFDFHANKGDVYTVHLAYDGKVLTETITDTTLAAKPTATIHYNIDIPAIVGGPCAYVGFTAGTGGAQAEQDILNWKYTGPVAAQFNKADFNHSGKVDFADLLILAQNYGKAADSAHGDANGDGKVDFSDLLILAQNYGKTGPEAAKTRGSMLSDVVGLVKTH